MSEYGLRISKSGSNVLTDTDNRNLVFTSKGSVLKVFLQGSVNVSITSAGGGAEITHNLGYIPLAFVTNATSGYLLPVYAGLPGEEFWMDTTKLYIAQEGIGQPNTTVTYKYVILVDKIE